MISARRGGRFVIHVRSKLESKLYSKYTFVCDDVTAPTRVAQFLPPFGRQRPIHFLFASTNDFLKAKTCYSTALVSWFSTSVTHERSDNHSQSQSTDAKSNLGSSIANSSSVSGLNNELSSGLSSSMSDPSTTHFSSAVRPKLRVRDILITKPAYQFTLPKTTTVDDAISFFVKQRIGSCLALDSDESIAGVFTARDILRFLEKVGSDDSKTGKEAALSYTVADLMTKKEKMVFCSLSDSLRRCRETMYQLKIRNMPVIEKGKVFGIITVKDLTDSTFSIEESGGKKGYIQNLMGRVGLPVGTRLNEEQSVIKGKQQQQLAVDISSFALPHPYKTANSVAANRRQYGPSELSTDMSSCEDAHFAIAFPVLKLDESSITTDKPNSSSNVMKDQAYICVADGVGSWRQFGVDPKLFSHRLVGNARKCIEANIESRLQSQAVRGRVAENGPIHPLDVIIEAWNATVQDKVTGSCTICVATLDQKLNQLSYSNLGDCGLMVVRHIDSETAGYMRERSMPRHMRRNDLRIAYLSQQQLKSFNLPFQLGYSAIENYPGTFETPADADTASIPIMPGDVVIVGTDGLFDNLDLDEIVAEVDLWEKTWFPSVNGEGIKIPQNKGQEAMDKLAEQLVRKARDYSLDVNRDGPFAVLAKENDIMWSGGRPDDTSVVVMRIYQVV